VTSSNSEATRLIRSGGIYVNSRRVTDEKERLVAEQAIEGELFLIRKGKRDNFLIRIARATDPATRDASGVDSGVNDP
jgi:tyrosyl-tRNA synthetase